MSTITHTHQNGLYKNPYLLNTHYTPTFPSIFTSSVYLVYIFMEAIQIHTVHFICLHPIDQSQLLCYSASTLILCYSAPHTSTEPPAGFSRNFTMESYGLIEIWQSDKTWRWGCHGNPSTIDAWWRTSKRIKWTKTETHSPNLWLPSKFLSIVFYSNNKYSTSRKSGKRRRRRRNN